MFRTIILASVAAVGLTVAPELGTSNADAAPVYHRNHYPVYHRPYYPGPVRVNFTIPVPVATPVYIAPVCHQYEVFYRPNCNAPWQCGGSFTDRCAADARVGFYRSQYFESYIAVR